MLGETINHVVLELRDVFVVEFLANSYVFDSCDILLFSQVIGVKIALFEVTLVTIGETGQSHVGIVHLVLDLGMRSSMLLTGVTSPFVQWGELESAGVHRRQAEGR